jgi:PAS domain S-box-containing protein
VLQDIPFTADVLLDLLLDTVVVVDAHGRFLYVSASAGQLFGYTPAELRGTYMIELVHPEDRGRTLQMSWQVMSGEPKVGHRNRYIRKDGRVVVIEWSAQWSEKYDVRIGVARRVPDPE